MKTKEELSKMPWGISYSVTKTYYSTNAVISNQQSQRVTSSEFAIFALGLVVGLVLIAVWKWAFKPRNNRLVWPGIRGAK